MEKANSSSHGNGHRKRSVSTRANSYNNEMFVGFGKKADGGQHIPGEEFEVAEFKDYVEKNEVCISF